VRGEGEDLPSPPLNFLWALILLLCGMTRE
jgi:hypothetical protein